MRNFLSAALVLLAPTAGLAATFDVSLDEINGDRVLVIARSGGGAAGVAAGAEDLKILRGEEAERAIASLAKVDAPEPGGAAESGGKKQKKKIVIHKVNVDEDQSGGSDRELRIIRKTDGGRREEDLLNDEEGFLIDGETAAASMERRIIRLKGVDEARAIKFIDDTKGLDAGERIELKAAAGL